MQQAARCVRTDHKSCFQIFNILIFNACRRVSAAQAREHEESARADELSTETLALAAAKHLEGLSGNRREGHHA